ncbi:hypothetical protein TNCV_3467801 [Trichonephila clavipes]|nr:hypothetical protein TNCV_3467801 [Trichonephila clavipes]
MNSSQHRCMNQAPSSENQTQQRSLNNSLKTLLVAPWFIWVVCCLTVARLFSRTHICSHQSPLSPMARGTPHLPRH